MYNIFFGFRLSLLFSSGSITAGPVFVKFENETNDVELITENRPQQRKTSFDNPTYSAVENLTQSQVRLKFKKYIIQQLLF